MEEDNITKNVIEFILNKEREKRNKEQNIDSMSEASANGINSLFNSHNNSSNYENVFSPHYQTNNRSNYH